MAQFYYKSIRADGEDFWEQFELEILGITREPLRCYSDNRSRQWVVRPTVESVMNWHNSGKLVYEVVQVCEKEPFPETVKEGFFTKHQSLSYCDTHWKKLPKVFGFNKRDTLVGVCFAIDNVIPHRIFQYDRGTYGRPYSFSTQQEAEYYRDKKSDRKQLLTRLASLEEHLENYNEIQGRVRYHHLASLKVMIFTDNPESRLLAICRKRSLELTSLQHRQVSTEIEIVFYPTKPHSEPEQYTLEQQRKDIANCQEASEYSHYIDVLTHLLPEQVLHQAGQASVATYSSPAGVANYGRAFAYPDSLAASIPSNGGGGSATAPNAPLSSSSSSSHVQPDLGHRPLSFEQCTAMAPIALKLGTLVQEKFMKMVRLHADVTQFELQEHYTPKMWKSIKGEHFRPSGFLSTFRTHVLYLCSKGEADELQRWLELLLNYQVADHQVAIHDLIYTLFKICIKYNNYSCLQVLLNIMKTSNVEIHADHSGSTPLHFACGNGYLEVVRLLLRHGVEANLATNKGWTPIMITCAAGHLDIVKLLLCQPDIDLLRYDSVLGTPAFIAYAKGHHEVVPLLFNHRSFNVAEKIHLISYIYDEFGGSLRMKWKLFANRPLDNVDAIIESLKIRAKNNPSGASAKTLGYLKITEPVGGSIAGGGAAAPSISTIR